MIPKKLSRFTNVSAMRSNHVADTTNPMSVMGTCFTKRSVKSESYESKSGENEYSQHHTPTE